MVIALAQHAQAQFAVIEQQGRADFGGCNDLGVRQADAPRVTRERIHIEDELLPGLQLHSAGLEFADAQLRPLHIGENADGPALFLLDRADHFDSGSVLLMRAMGEIQPEHIGAVLEEVQDHLRRGTGRAQRGDDFCAAVPAQPFSHANLM